MKNYNIRAFSRGLRVLELLALNNGLTISAMVRSLDLPQPTVSRLLKTLQESGYVIFNALNKTFHVSSRVAHLGTGVRVDPWIAEVAGPIANRLSEDIAWPVFIGCLFEHDAYTVWSTASPSKVEKDRFATGFRLRLLASGSGLMMVAQLRGRQRDRVILDARKRDPDALQTFGNSRKALLSYLDEISTNRYHLYVPKDPARRWLSVPISRSPLAPAVLTVAFHSVDYSDRKLLSQYLPKLRAAAAAMAF